MTTPPTPSTPPPTRDAHLARAGLNFVRTLLSGVRSRQLYPADNQRVRDGISSLAAAASEILATEPDLSLQVAGKAVFINDTRLRSDLGSWATLSSVVGLFERLGLGNLHAAAVRNEDWAAALDLLSLESDPDARVPTLLEERTDGRITARPPGEARETVEDPRAPARRAYGFAVQTARDTLDGVRLGQSLGVKRVKRAVQMLIDEVFRDPHALLGMATLRDYDEYTGRHSVNVCIFSLTLGKRLGLNKQQLYELGVGALLHDVGKVDLPIEITLKAGALTDAEWAAVKEHPTHGMLTLLRMVQETGLPERTPLLAYEHHMKVDLTGYPSCLRPRTPTLYSRIVALADGFDAGTSKRSYQPNPSTPDRVLKEMRDSPQRGVDPLLVKAFISVTGIYPVGTVVVLDTYEVGIVARPGPETDLDRPTVFLVYDDMGLPYEPPLEADLMEVDPDSNRPGRTIIKATDPETYGLRVADYLA